MSDILVNTDAADESRPVIYYPPELERVTRAPVLRVLDDDDFEEEEIERLTIQLETARVEYRKIYARSPMFFRAWLDGLGRVLRVE